MSTAIATTLAGPMTAAQRRALFAAATSRGIVIDDLRAMTPCGSISAMTRVQASDLLDRINRGSEYEHPRRTPRGPRRPKGVYAIASIAQRRKIEALRIDLGWPPEKLWTWLSERTHIDGRPMTELDSTNDASAVIELLKQVLQKTIAARRRASDREIRADFEPQSNGG